jgi:hypothetical protein
MKQRFLHDDASHAVNNRDQRPIFTIHSLVSEFSAKFVGDLRRVEDGNYFA